MNYISTRGAAPPLGFRDVALRGLAEDGGLYVPEDWPQLGRDEIASFAGRPFEDIAAAVIGRFAGEEMADAAIAGMAAEAMAGFRHPARTPLVQIAPDHFLLELFHGPTLAFKDVAMQFLARLMDDILAERGERATVLVATSGDTGAAAAEAFRGRAAIDLVILFPEGRISDVQRRQMTTVAEPNVHAFAVAGTFDDCQAMVKALFMDTALRAEARLTGVNSINWARIVPQMVYFFAAATALGAPMRPVSFTVPTGNFGDIFAGYAAARMGLPVERLVIATNENDILHRLLETGRYEPRAVRPTSSPSMDIQVASNFERQLFEATGRKPAVVRALMTTLKADGRFAAPPAALAKIRAQFASCAVSERETLATIADVHAACGLIVDPHTAVGIAAARRCGGGRAPMVTLSTAHPAKFPDAVAAACGVRPALPERLAAMMSAPERVERLPAEPAAAAAAVRRVSRAASADALA